MYDYKLRQAALNNCFTLGKDCEIAAHKIQIRFFDFESSYCSESEKKVFHFADRNIPENFSFKYPVFFPSKHVKYNQAILLLHGLNERSWNKYLTWAEYICLNTGMPVILFPIAYHINRGPEGWSNPRMLVSALNSRKEKYLGDRSISYANLALSDRLSEHPSRFYISGRQTLFDLTHLFEEIKWGRHPLFREDATINIFAYSIGAFLTQIALMANYKNLFSSSRLFMFCGGSIFSSMYGVSRSILDLDSFRKLRKYYIEIFGTEPAAVWKRDNIYNAFRRMISPEKFRKERESFFALIKERISGIALLKDIVIPYSGVQEAMGAENIDGSVQLSDFSFSYTHENPFPLNEKDSTALNNAFTDIFSKAVSFLLA